MNANSTTPHSPLATDSLKNQIIIWVKEQDYWLQYASKKLMSGEPVTEPLLSDVYRIFKEEYRLSAIALTETEISFEDLVDTVDEFQGKLILRGLRDIKNVNALAHGQAIEIGPNLTVIYGANGAGKSGYIRLLNNAFNSRGDKLILPNVFLDTEIGTPECTFNFQEDSRTYDLQYPQNKDVAEFKRFGVFDSSSVRVHLENDNHLNFTPNGFVFFESLIALITSLKSMFNDEITSKSQNNTFIIHFPHPNAVSNIVSNLAADTDIAALKTLATITEQDEIALIDLQKQKQYLTDINVPAKINALQQVITQTKQFTEQIGAHQILLAKERIQEYKDITKDYHKLKQLSTDAGIATLEEYQIAGLGSAEWKQFILSAQQYAMSIAAAGLENSYPKTNDNCLLCLQPLAEKNIQLISQYWQLLRSDAEKKLSIQVEKIKHLLKQLRALPTITFNNSTALHQNLATGYKELVSRWESISIKIENYKAKAISSLSTCVDDFLEPEEFSKTEFEVVIQNENAAIAKLIQNDPKAELVKIQNEIQLIADRSLLSKLLDQVLNYINNLKWLENANNSLSAFRTNSMTKKQGELFNTHVTEAYIALFNSECSELRAPAVVNVTQRNTKLSTLRKLQVGGEIANRVLSEGEQRSISLADFLTEIQLNPNNAGVIFDDPVTSLDHERRELIAKRLVNLSNNRQVIIFTHDISFLYQLSFYAEYCDGLELKITTLRKIGNQPGIIKPELPWIAQKLKDRIGFLKNRMAELKKLEKEGKEDDYNFAIKAWYGLLREAWERAVEERLFKGTIERFSGEVQTMRLLKVEITKQMLDSVEVGMTSASKWVHDQAMGLNPQIPDSTKAESDLNKLVSFSELCKPA